MKRRWKILLGVLGVLAVLLAVNAITTGSQTKEARVTAEGGEILELSRGAVQVTDSTAALDPGAQRRFALSQPIVLLHCYGCSLHWFDALEPLLARNHRVIRIDLLGFGGSEKQESGYSIPEQAATVAEALNELGVEGALVAGNSMGASVAASLAEQASQLVDRAVVIDMAPNTTDYGPGLPFLAELSYVPVLGPALWRITPDFVVRSTYEESFAPGFDLDQAFEDPDQVLADFDAMTYTSFDEVPSETDDFAAEIPLDQRFAAAAIPLMVIFGAEDQLFDVDDAISGYEDVPGVRTEIVENAGHAPQVERPEEVAALLEDFAVELEPEPAARPPRRQGRNRGGNR